MELIKCDIWDVNGVIVKNFNVKAKENELPEVHGREAEPKEFSFFGVQVFF